MSAKGRPRTFRVATVEECGEKITAEAWCYRRTASLSVEMYIQVKDAAGNWATLRVLVPR